MNLPLLSAGPEWQALAKRGWPVKVLLLVVCFLAVLVAGYVFHGRGLIAEIQTAKAQRAELQAQWTSRSAEAELLGAYQGTVRDLEAALQRSRSELFVDDGLAGLLHSLNQRGDGLKFEQVTALDSAARQHYVGLPIDVRASGGYPALQRFLSRLAELDRLVTLETLHITLEEGALQMRVGLQAYRAVQSRVPAELVVQLSTEPRDPFVVSESLVAPLEEAVMVGHLKDQRGPVALVRVGAELHALREGDTFGPERVATVDEEHVELTVPEQIPRLLRLGSVGEG